MPPRLKKLGYANVVVGPLVAFALMQVGHVSMRNVFWIAARFGVTVTFTLYGPFVTTFETGPGPTRAAMFLTLASALAGGTGPCGAAVARPEQPT